MRTQKLDGIFTVDFGGSSLDLESASVPTHLHDTQAPVIVAGKTGANDAGSGALHERIRAKPIAVQDEEPSCGQDLRKRPLLRQHSFEVAEEFEVFAPDAGDHAEIRLNHFQQGA